MKALVNTEARANLTQVVNPLKPTKATVTKAMKSIYDYTSVKYIAKGAKEMPSGLRKSTTRKNFEGKAIKAFATGVRYSPMDCTGVKESKVKALNIKTHILGFQLLTENKMKKKTETWFVADTHFFHNLMKQTRNFATVEDHNKAVADSISMWVKPEDTLCVLGDFCFGGIAKHKAAFDLLLDSYNRINETNYSHLPYKIRLVMGNHDQNKVINKLVDGAGHPLFNSRHGSLSYKASDDGLIVATHIPIHPINMTDREYWKLNVHGHIHEYKIDDPRYLCVSWDHYRKPLSLTSIINHEYRKVSNENN